MLLPYTNADHRFTLMIAMITVSISAEDERFLHLLIKTDKTARAVWASVLSSFSVEDLSTQLDRLDKPDMFDAIRKRFPELVPCNMSRDEIIAHLTPSHPLKAFCRKIVRFFSNLSSRNRQKPQKKS